MGFRELLVWQGHEDSVRLGVWKWNGHWSTWHLKWGRVGAVMLDLTLSLWNLMLFLGRLCQKWLKYRTPILMSSKLVCWYGEPSPHTRTRNSELDFKTHTHTHTHTHAHIYICMIIYHIWSYIYFIIYIVHHIHCIVLYMYIFHWGRHYH